MSIPIENWTSRAADHHPQDFSKPPDHHQPFANDFDESTKLALEALRDLVERRGARVR
jgi:hypothetical protein